MLKGTRPEAARLSRGATALLVALSLLSMAAPQANAQVKQIFASGQWSAYGGTAPDNQRVCGIQTAGPGGGRLMIEQQAGQTGLNLMLQKGSWSIPADTPIKLSFLFNGRLSFPGGGTGAGDLVTVAMTFEQTKPFMRAVRQDRQMQVSFPTGNEPPWSISLLGTGAVLDAFDECRAGLVSNTPTQPFIPTPAPAGPPAPGAAAPAPGQAPPAATPPATPNPTSPAAPAKPSKT
jgi:hypothetical protein